MNCVKTLWTGWWADPDINDLHGSLKKQINEVNRKIDELTKHHPS